MPFGEVKLIPGVNVERTPTLLEAGVSQSQLIRYKDGLIQKYGGWEKYYAFALSGRPRDLHGWQDLNNTDRLLVGTTSQLALIASDTLSDITPQQLATDPTVNFTTTINSTTVEITDNDALLTDRLTINDFLFIETPVAVGGLVLFGIYSIDTIVGADTYRITASRAATSSVASGGAVPVFTSTVDSATLSVLLTGHGVAVGDKVVFNTSTTGNGVTVSGHYTVASVTDANNFSITMPNQASASGSFSMNGGAASFLYYIAIGPQAAGAGYGTGGYGEGGYGTGVVPTGQTGTPRQKKKE